MTILINIGAFLFTLLLLISIHEWGHFWVARRCGVKTLCFSIGFGRPLWHRLGKDGTRYQIAALPIGGYVQLLDEHQVTVPAHERHLAFNHQSITKRFMVVTAGPLINFLFAILAFWGMYVLGFNASPAKIGHITPHSIAAQAGLSANSTITAIDHHATPFWPEVMMALIKRLGDDDTMHITTTNGLHTLPLDQWQLNALHPDLLSALGIQPYLAPTHSAAHMQHVQFDPLHAIPEAWHRTMAYCQFHTIAFYQMIRGKLSIQSLGGPITIYDISSMAFRQGVVTYLRFLAILSSMLAIVNILPIPGLDGGHLVFLGIEAIRRKALSMASQGLITRIGLLCLLSLMALATINDLMRLF